jgi:hypothetical protein
MKYCQIDNSKEPTANALQKTDENYFLKGEIRSLCYQTFF